MHKIELFGEDYGHEIFIKALIQKLGHEQHLVFDIHEQSVRGGHGKVITELKQYFRDLIKRSFKHPDLIVIAIDANCKGFSTMKKEIVSAVPTMFSTVTICAIPDPHIERWMLSDSAAFKKVLGKSCTIPNYKCQRDYYKELLLKAVYNAGTTPQLGGNEYAEDIVNEMNLNTFSDNSLRHFVEDFRNAIKNLDTPISPNSKT